ncbi:MAG: hypothetical protein JRC90_09870 [Deltaproteobacteria bacterium]|nr:hypothetical protein [Deltaproteobacteria bacterium]
MTEQAKISLGVSIMRGGEIFGEVIDVTVPGATAEKKETLAQNNIGGVKTKTPGWVDWDDLTFTINYIGSAAQSTLLGDITKRKSETWLIIMPPSFGAAMFSFSGYLGGTKPATDGSDIGKIEVTVMVNGSMTEVTAAGAPLTTPFFVVADTAVAPNTLTPSPVASATDYEYEITAYSDSTAVTITPTATAGTIYVNGTVVATGVASAEISIGSASGEIVMIPIVVYQINKVPKIYWLRVVRGYEAGP